MDGEGLADNTAGIGMNGWSDYSPHDSPLAWATSVWITPRRCERKRSNEQWPTRGSRRME